MPTLKSVWKERLKLCAKGEKLWDKGYKLRVEGHRLWDKSDKLWTEAVLATYGNVPIKWTKTGCIVEGVTYRK